MGFHGDSGEDNFARGKREALEGREAIERRDRIEAESAGAQSDLRRDDIASGKDAQAKYDPSGDVGAIEPSFLLDVARRLIEAARAQAMRFPANRRD